MSRMTMILLALVVGVLAVALVRAQDKDTSTLEGKPAPDFTLKTLDGQSVTLSLEKGSVVVIDNWATWCPPCRKSLPHIQALSKDEARAAKGLKVWAVNAREPEAKVKKFLQENKYTFTVPMDADGKFGKSYLVRGIPTTVIVGRDGNIAKVFVGYGEGMDAVMNKAVDEALAKEK